VCTDPQGQPVRRISACRLIVMPCPGRVGMQRTVVGVRASVDQFRCEARVVDEPFDLPFATLSRRLVARSGTGCPLNPVY